MTSQEFTESLAFERLEPDPGLETVRLLGMLVLMYANTHRDTKSKPEPYDYDEFVPDPYGIPRAERIAAFRETERAFRAASAERRRQKKEQEQVH